MKNKALLTLLIILMVFSANSNSYAQSTDELDKSDIPTRFEQLKNELFEEPYSSLPYYKVSRKLFGPSRNNDKNKLLHAARRTFDDSSDLIEFPAGQKLLNANGICFTGRWRITDENSFSGLYRQGSDVPAIVRASVALSGTRQKHKRAFGLAIKLLPDDLQTAPSLNAFVLHSMGGTRTKHVLDLSMDNAPPLGRLPSFRDLSTALRLRSDLEKADKEKGATKPSVSFRPVTAFANYSTDKQSINSPKWLRLSPLTTTRVDQDDFRNELQVTAYPEQQIRYAIEVAANSDNGKKSTAQWQTIGQLVLDNSVTSLACDTRLHFQHPTLNTKKSDN